jgi:hypothetical protein
LWVVSLRIRDGKGNLDVRMDAFAFQPLPFPPYIGHGE